MLGMMSLKMGFSMGGVGPAASGIVVPLAGIWDGTYVDAADGPVDVGSGKIHPWVALEGDNLEQSSSGDRGTLTTLYYGGENAVLFNGVNEFMRQSAIATLLSGSDTPFTMAIDCHVLTVAANDVLAGLGNDDVVGAPFHLLRTHASTGASWQTTRVGDTGSTLTTQAGTTSTGVHRLIMVFDGSFVSLWDNGTKIIDQAGLDAEAATFDNFTIACRILQSAGNFMHAAYRRVAVSSTAISDANVATLEAAWSA
jgi:hypothetical protein